MSDKVVDIGRAVNLACLWEATAAKPGNVNRSNDFHDTTLVDFLNSAAAISPVFNNCQTHSLSQLVLRSVQETKQVSNRNTNLGILLLLAPLAKSCSVCASENETQLWVARLEKVLAEADSDQAAVVCQAIALCSPGGLGEKEYGDVRKVAGEKEVGDPSGKSDNDSSPDLALVPLMRLAEDEDMIARQYSKNFSEVFEVAFSIEELLENRYPLQLAIIGTFLRFLDRYPDSLIRRKCGKDQADQVSAMASEICQMWGLKTGCRSWNDFQDVEKDVWDQVSYLDFYLRSDGNRRNPGTSADFIAAGLFILLCQNKVSMPVRW